MEENNKAEQEKINQLVKLNQNAIIHLVKLLKKKEEKETEFWSSLLKNLNEVKQENGK